MSGIQLAEELVSKIVEIMQMNDIIFHFSRHLYEFNCNFGVADYIQLTKSVCQLYSMQMREDAPDTEAVCHFSVICFLFWNLGVNHCK